jgi:hypothetical protein
VYGLLSQAKRWEDIKIEIGEETKSESRRAETHLFSVRIEECIEVDHVRMGHHSHDLQFSVLYKHTQVIQMSDS